jgi:transposase
MCQEAVICFFALKYISSRAITAEFESVSRTEGLAIQTVKKWRNGFAEGRTALDDDRNSGRPLRNNESEIISSMVEEAPFHSWKVLCRQFRIARTTCLRIQREKINLRWAPDALNEYEKGEKR